MTARPKSIASRRHLHGRRSLWRPFTWRRWVRRLFLLALPLAVLVWASLLLLDVLRRTTIIVVEAADRFWNKPSRVRSRYSIYG